MDEPEFRVSYVSFRTFIECTGRPATHCVSREQYVGPVTSDGPCFSKTDSNVLLCDHCFAFWWQCRENDDMATWGVAVCFRDQYEDNQVARVLEF
jgi:hypothetical protein